MVERNRDVVFVAGVHGVGKSSICEKLGPVINGEVLSASGLIKNRKQLGVGKATAGIEDNQNILVDELERFETNKPYILLDGHCCLFDSALEIQALPETLFKSLGVRYVLLLVCPPDVISERLSQRDEGRSGLTLAHSESLQNAEVNQAYKISSALGIPITEFDTGKVISSNDIEELAKKIKGSFAQ